VRLMKKMVCWNSEKRCLEPNAKRTQIYKALKFLRLGRLEKMSTSVSERLHYRVLPIPFYNITTYDVTHELGKWACSCQYASKNATCSHILAVKIKEGILGVSWNLVSSSEEV
jgi:hypothetical protein